MKRVLVLVEGQTEEKFVKEILVPYFYNLNIHFIPIIIRTSKNGKGGDVNYDRARPQIKRLCLENQNSLVTTMFDYYGLNNDFPGSDIKNSNSSPEKKVLHIERKIKEDLALVNFIPNLLLHEFEALLYSDPDKFKTWFNNKVVSLIYRDKSNAATPEHINHSPMNAPSKRLIRYAEKHGFKYEKVIHGTIISLDIGLECMRRECAHFNSWINAIINHIEKIEA